jgi:RNA polymerase primary sigma factor
MDRPSMRLLTATQEVRLSRRIRRGDRTAKQQLIEANLRLVHHVAADYRGFGVEYDDLVQEATVGLVRAVETFDHRRGLKFSTYAIWPIRRAIIDAIGEARPIRIPARARRQLAEVRRAESELRTQGPGAATNDAIAQRTELSAERVRALRSAAHVTASLDQQIATDGTTLAELIRDPKPADPLRDVELHETRREVQSMLKLLPARHRDVLTRRYGIDDGREQPHTEIGAALGLGEERSRQLESEALHRLRELGGGRPVAAA